MYSFTIPMALMDFIPVALFGIALWLLLADLHNKLGKGSYALFSAGGIYVFAAGFLKAVWKLLYAAGICDFNVLHAMFLPVVSLGYLLIALGLLGVCKKRPATAALAVAPPLFGGSILFIGLMVLGLGTMCTVLSILSARLKRKGPIALFILGFLFYMAMGYLSGQDTTTAIINWIEQGINCIGQGLLLWGILVLHRAGLKDLTL